MIHLYYFLLFLAATVPCTVPYVHEQLSIPNPLDHKNIACPTFCGTSPSPCPLQSCVEEIKDGSDSLNALFFTDPYPAEVSDGPVHSVEANGLSSAHTIMDCQITGLAEQDIQCQERVKAKAKANVLPTMLPHINELSLRLRLQFSKSVMSFNH